MLVSYGFGKLFIPEPTNQLEKLSDPPFTEPLSTFLLTFQYFSQVLFLFWDFRQEYFGIKMTHFIRRQNTACTWCWSVKRPFDITRFLYIQKYLIKEFNVNTLVLKWHTYPWVFSLVLCSTKQKKREQNINLTAVYKLLLDCLFVCKHGKIWKCRYADNNHTQTGKHFSQVWAHSHCVFMRACGWVQGDF